MSEVGAEPVADVLPPSPLERWRARFGPPAEHRITRFLVLRLLGVVYLFAFLGLTQQVLPLVGEHGLEPAVDFLARVDARDDRFLALPTLFRFGISDALLEGGAWLGVAIAAVVVAGFATAPAMFVLWALYLSYVNVGQTWFGYGWEIQLAETGFLAIFLCGLDPRPFPARPPPLATIWLQRWLAFRIMLGAGLIKWRGDPCWQELTCLDWHFETQPVPNPLSPWFHFLPHGVLAAGVVVNHVAELACPWAIFGPRRLRHAAAALMVGFQVVLVLSGNLSFLNWLTLVPLVACFDDRSWRWLAPSRVRAWLDRRAAAAWKPAPTRAHTVAAGVLVAFVALLSIEPVANLASKQQRMNASFDPFALVNTYGAFGSVGERRFELVVEGTLDADPDDPAAAWRAYDFACKPGDPARRPCVLGPYHHRLDWQMWFAAMGTYDDEPWTMHLVWKLLHADRATLGLLAGDPFAGARPSWIRVRLYRYRFARTGEAWWTRELEGDWLPPVDAASPWLREFVEGYGWRTGG